MKDKKLVPDEARDAFGQGYNIGFDAVERCSKEVPEGNEPTKGAMTGLLASVIEALYTLAPSEETADFLIDGCSTIGKGMAKENKKESHNRLMETVGLQGYERTTEPLQ